MKTLCAVRSIMFAVLTLVVVASALFFCRQGFADDEKAKNQVYVNQLSDSSFLYETSIADLAQADSYYEGQTVMVKGEVVGERVNDELLSDRCWVTLQDDEPTPSIVAVVMDKEQTQAIDTYGGYGKRGTTLQVRGTFHLECSEHQGMSDIHVEELSAISAGYDNPKSVDSRVVSFGVITLIIGLVLLAVYQIRREKML